MSSLALRSGVPPEHNRLSIPDEPIGYSVLNRSRQRGASRHFGFFQYPAKKPWSVVQEYIKHYTAPGDLVCDPFAGSGVTPVEALVLRRRAVASDINPVARFLTRMTAIAPVDLERLQLGFEQVRSEAQVSIEALDAMPDADVLDLLRLLDYPKNAIPGTVRRAGLQTVDQLHTPRQLAGLTILRDTIDRVPDSVARDLLRVALANAVRYANTTYDLPYDKSGKRRSPYRGNANFLRRWSFSPAASGSFYENLAWPTFSHTFRSVLKAKEETNNLIGDYYSDHNFGLADVPAARIHEVTGEEAVNYIFTDPPYANDINFLDLSALWAAWLRLEIDDEARQNELTTGGIFGKTRGQFEGEFAASMESIARALKREHWFTLVYKHRDLSLWQFVVSACEDAGLRYVNAVWQDVKISSTRQIESPDINPSGDMYLNFRKLSPQRFEAIYPRPSVTDLPTRENYVEREVERLIVSYLGADIELIASEVIRQVLDSRVFRDYRENPDDVAENLQDVLKPPRFEPWRLLDERVLWVLGADASVDATLPAIDRARYYVFDFLRRKGQATEGAISGHLLTRFAQEPGGDRLDREVVRALLRHVGSEISPRRWRFDTQRLAEYKQLRLFFGRSRADELRDRLERRSAERGQWPLRPDLEGIGVLLDRLWEANGENRQFAAQRAQLMGVLQEIFDRLRGGFEDHIELVTAIGDWARYGADLRGLPYEDVVIQIVLRTNERTYDLYQRLADEVFSGLEDEDIFVQFRLETRNEWRHAQEVARVRGSEDALGIPLLSRK